MKENDAAHTEPVTRKSAECKQQRYAFAPFRHQTMLVVRSVHIMYAGKNPGENARYAVRKAI